MEEYQLRFERRRRPAEPNPEAAGRGPAGDATVGNAYVREYQPDELDYLRAVGDGIRIRRLAAKLTQQELADLAGMDRLSIGYIERAQQGLRLITIRRISEALGVTLHDLLLCELADDRPTRYRQLGRQPSRSTRSTSSTADPADSAPETNTDAPGSPAY